MTRVVSGSIWKAALSGIVLLGVASWVSGVGQGEGVDPPHGVPGDVADQDRFERELHAALDEELRELLDLHGFTGWIDETLELRLGRPVDDDLADLGRLLFFDPIMALRGDNSCAGCHAPQFGLGDSQSIAIGIMNNNVVGPNRLGPRNERRSPMVVNSAFLPALMWNTRFFAPTGDPFDNSLGFVFPLPEGMTRFPPGDPEIRHLLAAQGQLPQTELVEMTGFTGMAGADDLESRFDQFDDGVGIPVPEPDDSGFRHEPIRDRLLEDLNANEEYVALFANIFPDVNAGGPVTFNMVGNAIAEFQIAMTFAKAPIDRYARGNPRALTLSEKRGAILFFGKAGCVQCHTVSGQSNEMFSDFQNHNIGVPQIAPSFGLETGNVVFDGEDEDEDFGLEQLTDDPNDRYKFRTSPLRNVALQPTFFHNGAFTRLEDAILHHLDVETSLLLYDPEAAGVAPDLRLTENREELLETLDPLIAEPLNLTEDEFDDLVQFVWTGLLDPRAMPDRLVRLVPKRLPSGLPVHFFE
jgi:cytochrome c peroxidase